MTWVSPVVHSTGDFITASVYNNEITGNMNYLKSNSIAGTVTQSQPSRNITGSIYHNTNATAMFVAVSCSCSIANSAASYNAYFTAICDSSSSPTTQVALAGFLNITDPSTVILDGLFSLTFVVQPGYYYKITPTVSGGSSSVSLEYWTEWVLS